MCPCISELAFKHFSHLTCLCHFALSCFIKQDLVFSFEMCSRHVSCAHRFLFCFSVKPYVHLRIIICQKLRKKKKHKNGYFWLQMHLFFWSPKITSIWTDILCFYTQAYKTCFKRKIIIDLLFGAFDLLINWSPNYWKL